MQRSRSISNTRFLDDEEEIPPPTPSVYFTPPGSRCGLLLHNTVEKPTTNSSFTRSRRHIEATRGNSKIPILSRKANYNTYTEKKIPISSIQQSHKRERIRWQGGHGEYHRQEAMNDYYVYLRFKNTYAAFGEKRYCGTMIEKEMHICWIRCSGLELDKDGEIFKYFLGRKSALNFEEYKQFLEELCDIYELDYSEVIKTMAFIRIPSSTRTLSGLIFQFYEDVSKKWK